MPSQPYKIFSEDEDGDQSLSSMYTADTVLTPADMAALLTEFEALTASRIYKHALKKVASYAGAAASDNPYDVADKVVFQFRSDINPDQINEFVVPAPLSSIFLADDETVDDANLDVQALVAAIPTYCTDPYGQDPGTYMGGFRIRRQRKS